MIMKTKAATHPRGNNIWHIIILKHSPKKFDNPDPHPNQLQSIGVSMSIVLATFLWRYLKICLTMGAPSPESLGIIINQLRFIIMK